MPTAVKNSNSGQGQLLVNFIDAVSIENNQLNLLMFGPSGHGKSSTGNSIIGQDVFPVSDEGDSQVHSFMSHDINCQGYKVKIVDSPPSPRIKENINTDVTGHCNAFIPSISDNFPDGCHAPILILKYGHRFELPDEFSMVMLKQMFGQAFIRNHCVCVITHGDIFERAMAQNEKYNSFQQWCEGQSGILANIFQAINYRCVLFDNENPHSGTKEAQVQQLMAMIHKTWTKPIVELSVSPQMRTKADIHALVETASSQEEYRQQLQFLISSTANYKFDPKQVQMSVTIFGAREHLQFAFKEFSNHQDFAKKLLDAPYLEPSSGTDEALALAREKSFGSDAGCRSDTTQIALMVTEGRTKDKSKTLDEADRLKSSGVIIMAAGVDRGNGNSKLIERLASDKTKAFVAKNYSELPKMSEQVFKETCAVAPQFASTADVLFILDSSGSIGVTDYRKELNFVVQLTQLFNIGYGAVRFSVMIFSFSPQLLFDFSLNTHQEVQRATLDAPYMDGGTDTAAALDLARTSVFGIGDGTRTKKIAIVITDGKSSDSNATSDAAARLERSGVLIMAIGVGNANQRELERIVSRPEDVCMVEDYDALQRIQDKIAQLTTNYENITSSPRPRGKSPERSPRPAPQRPAEPADPLGQLLGAFKFW